MKKLFLTLATLAAVTNGFAQGTIFFNNFVPGVVETRVYIGDYFVQRTGNTSTQTPTGTQDYTSFPLVTGSGFTAQLWSLPGNAIPPGVVTPYGVIDGSLEAANPTTTFRAGSAAGVVAATMVTLANVPADAANAVIQMRVFETSYGSWAAAVAAYNGSGSSILGASPMFVVSNIGGIVNTPPNLVGLTSFSLLGPEPSSMTLAGLGAVTMLLFRRKRGKR